ncbi:MAG: SRPBCC family protein [Acidimicrobiales bacterium]|jgi:carbon monoxide dehydrogenase subunit G|nr:SRPBCC family protein [Acidimicrobiales bacterium]HLV90419.1 SRPBCC family protein [Acidimicrobiia bacterium]
MKISQEFVVARDPDTVWAYFQDIPSVARCLPGAELTGQNDDGSFEGKLSAKLGPMTAAFEGTATVTPDPGTRSARIEGKGVDRKGGSRGQVVVDYRLEADGAGTKVTVDADVTLSGPAAQFGRTGLINEMSRRLIADFVECLEASLAAATPEEAAAVRAPEVRGFGLFFSALWAWIKKLFRKA